MRFISIWILIVASLAKHGEGEDEAQTSSSTTSTVTANSTSSVSSSSPASSPSPTSVNSFQFVQPGNATTCQNATIQWHSSSTEVPMTLTITSDPATGSSQSNSQGNSSLVSRMLTTTVLSTASQFMWDSVNVPEGFYVAVAFDTPHTAGLFAQSPPFFVQTGQNVSCLAATAIPSSSSSDSPSPTVSPGSEAASSSGASGPKKLSPGALAGTISAVVVGVILLLIAFTYPQWWRHALPRRSRNRRPGGPYYLF